MASSVIIPVLNEAAHIGQRLEALLPHFECIVVDGGSSDTTVNIAGSLGAIVVHSERGRAVQMNAGAAKASGEVFVFMHADTQPPEDFTEQLRQFEQAAAPWGFFSVKLRAEPMIYRVIEWFMNQRSRITNVATGDQLFCIRAPLFKAMGGYASIALMEDVELSKRLRKRARPYRFSSPVLCSARKWQKYGVCKTILLMWSLRLAYVSGVSPATLHSWYYGASHHQD